MKKALLDLVIHLMLCGYVLPVMKTIEKLAKAKTDQALIRYFIVQLLGNIEPPYSKEFITSLILIIQTPSTTEAFKNSSQKFLIQGIISKFPFFLFLFVFLFSHQPTNQTIDHSLGEFQWTPEEIASLQKLNLALE